MINQRLFLGGEKMLDIKFIRENPELVKQGIENKNEKHNTVDDILELDGKRRALLTQVEEKKAQKNKVSAEVGKLKKSWRKMQMK